MSEEKKKPDLEYAGLSVEELRRKLGEAQAIIDAMTSTQVDAMLGVEKHSLRRLSEVQEALLASEYRHAQLLQNMPAMVFELEPNGQVIYLNEAVYRITGYSRKDLADENFWMMLFPNSLSDQVNRLYVLFQRGDVKNFELTLHNSEGRPVIVELNSANIYNSSGNLERIVGIGVDITERKRVEEELSTNYEELQIADEELRVQNEELVAAQERAQAERQRYQELFEFAPDGYLVTDPNGIILEANYAATELLKVSRVALVGRSLAVFIAPEERETFHRYVNSLRDRYENRGWETVLQTEGGGSLPVSLIVGAVREERPVKKAGQGQTVERLIGLRWLIHDITRRKEAEAELRRQSRTLELLGTIAAAANQAGSSEEALTFALEKVCAFSDFPIGHVYLADPEHPSRLVPTDIWSLARSERYETFREVSQRLLVKAGAGLPGMVLQIGSPAWRTNVGEDEEFIRREPARKAGLRAAFAFPVMIGDEVAAVMEFFSQEAKEPDDRLMEVMRQVGTQLGRVIERKRAEQALRKSEARFRTIFNNAAIGVVLTDERGRFLECNPAFVEMMECSEAELRQLSYLDLTHPEDVRLSREHFEGMLRGDFDSYSLEKRYLSRKGNLLWVRLAVSIVRGEGDEPFYTIGMVENITEQKQMAFELAEVQSRLFDSAEAERLLLAQELHDGPVQDLYGITFQVESLRTSAQDESGREQLGEIKEGIQQVVRSLRATAQELRPPTLAPFGLEKAILAHSERFQEENPDLSIHLELEPDGKMLPERTRLALFRIYQQSLNNVLQHAQADNVWVRFRVEPEQVTLEVQDDGVGFQVPDRWIQLARAGHLGLVGATERAEAVGGRMEVISKPGAGALIRVQAPRAEPAAEEGAEKD